MNNLELSTIIAEGIKYYNENTSRRCIDASGFCMYDGENSINETEGCFVGRLMTPENKSKADELFGASVRELAKDNPELLPNWMLKDLDLVWSLQRLHDCDENWDYDGLSNRGKVILALIVRKHNLVSKLFSDSIGDGILSGSVYCREYLTQKELDCYSYRDFRESNIGVDKHSRLYQKINGSWVGLTIDKLKLIDNGFHS